MKPKQKDTEAPTVRSSIRTAEDTWIGPSIHVFGATPIEVRLVAATHTVWCYVCNRAMRAGAPMVRVLGGPQDHWYGHIKCTTEFMFRRVTSVTHTLRSRASTWSRARAQRKPKQEQVSDG